MKELPQFKSHKTVRAAKIDAIGPDALDLGEYGMYSVTAAWLARHTPQIGGYLVEYDDGYVSYSPAEAFEQGYRPVVFDSTEREAIQADVDRLTST